MHGTGDTADGVKQIFLDKQLCRLPDGCKVILPTAPKERVSALAFEELRAWFNVKSLKVDPKQELTREFFAANYGQSKLQEHVKTMTYLLKREIASLNF